jgi:predicted PurR-regulated permease PerM
MRETENWVFLGFVIAVSLAFGWVISPFYGAILWGVVIAITFAPFNRWLEKAMPRRQNSTALITLVAIIALVIVPSILIAISLTAEVIALYESVRTNEFDFARIVNDVQKRLPPWAEAALNRVGWTDADAIAQRISEFASTVLRFLAQSALGFSQSAFAFVGALGVMLYLTFFLLRDGDKLALRIGSRIPMSLDIKLALTEKFATVIRATIKGSVVVAIVQGVIGGLVFALLGIHAALLGGVVMGMFSLIPAVGTGLVWVPVAIYLLATGAIWQGAVLIFCGIFVIGMVDNVLRPILVGKETRMPDYVVLISTLGGLSIFGINGLILGPAIAALFMAAWDIYGNSLRGETQIARRRESEDI